MHGGTSPLSFERTANLRGKMESSTPFAKLFAKKVHRPKTAPTSFQNRGGSGNFVMLVPFPFSCGAILRRFQNSERGNGRFWYFPALRLF